MIDKTIDNRLATIEGHIKAVRKMVDENKRCVDVITQLMAIERSVKKAGVMVLQNHLNTCIKEAVEQGKFEEVNEFNKILEMYL